MLRKNLITFFIFSACLFAQNYKINIARNSAGGNIDMISSGGQYLMCGTVGQLSGQVSTASGKNINSGFWGQLPYAKVNLTVNKLSLGNTDVGQTATVYLKFQNIGTKQLAYSINLVSDYFSASKTTGIVEAGLYDSVLVSFRPVEIIGTITAKMQIQGNFLDNTCSIDLEGTAMSGKAKFDTVFTFKNLVAVTKKDTATFYIKNIGNKALNFSISEQKVDSNQCQILQPSNGIGSIQANSVTKLQFLFKPISVGNKSFTYSVNGNFIGTNGVIKINGVATASAILQNNKDTLNYATTMLLNRLDSVVITNTGSKQLIYNFDISSNNKYFHIFSKNNATLNTNITLEPDKSNVIYVEFKPQTDTLGILRANLSISGNFSNSPRVIPIIATTKGARLFVADTSRTVYFGKVKVGNSVSKYISLKNTGNYDMTVNLSKLPNNKNFQIDTTLPINLNPGKSYLAKVTYKPTKDTVESAIIAIKGSFVSSTNNIYNNNTYNVSVTAEGQTVGVADIGDYPHTGIDFKDTLVFKSKYRNITLNNIGTSDMNYKFEILPTSSDVFKITCNASGALAKKSSKTIQIQFSPSRPVDYRAYLKLSGDFDTSKTLIQLLGKGNPDNLKPTIIVNNTMPPYELAKDTRLSFQISDNDSVRDATIFYKKGNDIKFESYPLVLTSKNNYEYTISSAYTKDAYCGILYKVVATDRSNNRDSILSICNMKMNASSPVSISQIKNASYSSGFPNGLWQMISIPFALDNGKFTEVLTDFGASGKNSWEIFGFEGSQYVDVTNTGSFLLGKSFWLKQVSGKTKQITFGAGTFAELDKDGQYSIDLKKGFNQIGNPFPFNINWVTETNSNTLNLRGLFEYDGTKYSDTKETLQPFNGYFVYSPNDVKLIIIPNFSNNVSSKKITNQENSITSDWYLNIIAQDAISEDRINYLGVIDEKDNYSLEKYCMPSLPNISNAMEVYFDHSLEKGGECKYDIDIKSKGTDVYTWNLNAISYYKGNVTIKIFSHNLPDNLSFALYDLSHGRVVKNITDYSFDVKYSGQKIRFKVIVAVNDKIDAEIEKIRAQIPSTFTLAQNYPNPFNPSTTIKYSVPLQTKIKISIYDVTGRMVRNLVTNQICEPGEYQVMWDGKNNLGYNVSSGIYVYKLDSDLFSETKKMILVK